jgi:acyl-CoA synthetase (NDP forming)
MAGALAEEGYAVLREARVPCYPSIESCLAALDGLARWGAASRRPPRPRPVPRPAALPPGVLTERAARAFLAPYGIAGPAERFCESGRAARRAADALGYPVVLKVEAEGLAHKSEAGGVRVGLADGDTVAAAYDAMLADVRRKVPAARVRGVLVQAQARGVAELLVGAARDPRFGPVVSCGLGGIFVEVFEDVAVRLAPVDEAEAREMLASLRAYPVLVGARGRPRADLEAAARAVAAVSRAACDLGDALDSVEVNPLIVGAEGEGAVAVDALVIAR